MVFSDSPDSDDSFDDVDLACEIPPDLEEGCRGLDLGTLHQTLPEALWDRHERRAPASKYKPSRDMGRYKASLKNWMPVRKSNKNRDQMPLDQAGFFSYLTFSWVGPYMTKAYRYGLQPEDVPLCSTRDGCDHCAQRVEFMWNEEVLRNGIQKASLRRVAWRFTRTRILTGIFLYFLSLVFGFLGPVYLMTQLLRFCQDEEAPWWHGAFWAVGMAVSEMIRILLFGASWGVSYRTGIRLRSAVTTMLFKKVMRLSSLGDKSIGEVINLFANDSQRIYDVCSLGPLLFGGPFVAFIATFYVVYLLGPHALIGMLVFLLYYPVQYGVSLLTGYCRRRTIVITDKRVTLMKELLTCVKLIKMYAWEKPFSKTITDIRKSERFLLEMTAYVQSISVALTPVVPVLSVIVTFLVHISLGYELSPAEAFAVVAVMIARVRPSLNGAREALKTWDEASVVWPRFERVLGLEEMKSSLQKPLDRSVAVAISEATFAWHFAPPSKETKKQKRKRKTQKAGGLETLPLPLQFPPPPILIDIDLIIPKGHLVAVCGAVGAGKSSLLSAILGHMKTSRGRVSVDGSFAYVSQQAWIMNSSLRDNILFGEAFDPKRYYDVISACALSQDLDVLPAGDDTEIGERGINLSGGQRQRVSMARALYADRDIYLLDDPLSAVDGHVGKHIFEQCIRGALKGKTVVFVTHQLQYLSQCDEVIFMDDGRVLDQGRHVDLMSRSGPYSTLIHTFLSQEENQQTKEEGSEISRSVSGGSNGVSPVQSLPTSPAKGLNLPNPSTGTNESTQSRKAAKEIIIPDLQVPVAVSGRLTEAEKMEKGSIPWSTFHLYIKSAGGYIISCLVLLTFILNIFSTAFSSWWLAHWLNNGVTNATRMVGNETEYYMSVTTHPDVQFYQSIYGAFILVILLTSLLRSFSFMKTCLRASSAIHDKLFVKIFCCPMRFFDSTPVGRIINIFSRDLDEIDSRIPSSTDTLIQNILIVIMSIVFVVMAVPWFLVALVALTLIFAMYSRVFRRGLRDLTRLEHVSRSPIYSHVDASINGLSTVHAFGKQRHFVSKYVILQDENSSAYFLLSCSHRWLSVRLDFITVCGMGITAGLIVGLRGTIPAASAGLALAYASQLSGIMQYVVRLACETESRFTSVQRMQTYLLTLESEDPAIVKDRRPPEDWPVKGAIKFSNVKMRYRHNLPLVLDGVSFDIEPQAKIGIVGRTGSGKSSLGVALFRLVDLTSGLIKIDGINISEIGLEDLRSKLSIIPQDPVLFIGTIRYNLDPFQKYTDEAIWEAVEQTNMKDKIKALPQKLDSAVTENGENFSVGERQLLCMARALLRHSKILLLDEATAAIDTQTDFLVQKTLREAFKNCTILTIAHRLNTVIQCDKILVLDDGKVIEFDKPSVLMAKTDSIFAGMMSVAEVSDDCLLEL
ncbi:ATP-binding cassette sub-family C member 5-like isoform X1 [Daphnia pulex]|uniref:ATP-binding cassette sub-family C member 5-like isoform X1 n=1 Tax=Daphnia pulex TaxID=6669 RepID=UPI001EDFB48E|nr:ATP-binding cassette sub-family C member 5-like isoform X1 [Daphnia pulex]XP_046462038.1 ATP-binding cassette sub-family C member 5-like isoform X1 [Daphnia pulex]